MLKFIIHCLPLILVATAAATTANSQTLSTLLVTDSWSLFSTSNPSTVYTSVTVPHTVLGALLDDTTRYPFDPFYGKNLQQISETDFYDPWVYSTLIQFTDGTRVESTNNTRYVLRLHGLNYRADLWVHDALVVNATYLVGAFRRFELDVTSYVVEACSTIAQSDGSCALPLNLTVYPPHHHPGHWRSNSTDLGINFQDWNPHPPDLSMGLFAPVELIRLVVPPQLEEAPQSVTSSTATAAVPVTIDGFTVKTYIPPTTTTSNNNGNPYSGTDELIVFLNFSFLVRYWGTTPVRNQQFLVDLGFANEFGQPIRVTTDPVNFTTSPPSSCSQSSYHSWPEGVAPKCEVRVSATWQSNPTLILSSWNVSNLLWWPWQMGDQPLWNATIEDLRTGTTLQTFQYGIRQVHTEMNLGGALQFYINNVPLQFRGGGWTSEMFLRVKSEDRLRSELSLIREMGLNGIRLEGMLETDRFYEIADEFGLVLLPGLPCCDGWQHWDRWPEENYEISVLSMRDQARRLSRHPSVIGYFEASDSLPPLEVETNYLNALVLEAWPNAVISSASQQVSPLSGNPGVKMVGPYSWEPPSYWLVDGNGLVDGNYGGAWGFLTEGGPGEAPMTFASWNRTVPSDYLWNQSTQGMDSWWSWHMGEPYGHFRNLTFFQPALQARYGESFSAEEYLFKSQASNYEALRSYVESYSRNKHRNATGFVQWMLNNAWPSHLWHLYDYYLVAGGGYYGTKQACQPLHVMYSYNDGTVWIINSLFVSLGGVTVEIKLVDTEGHVRWSTYESVVAVPSDASFVLPTAVPLQGGGYFAETEVYFVWIAWSYTSPSTGNPVTQHNWYWLSASSTQQDVLDFPASNGFRTPCSSFTNFSALKTSLSSAATVSLLTTVISASEVEVTVNAPVSNPTIVFLVHLRYVNTTSNLEVTPVSFSDNYLTLVPGGSQLVTAKALLPNTMSLLSSDMELVVDSWNSVVSSN